MRKMKSTMAVFLSIVLVISAIFGQTSGTTHAKAAAGYGISGPRTEDNGVTTWDCIYFGNYWQKDTNGDETVNESDTKEPIKWRVLSVEGDDAFLMADQCLDSRQYDGDEDEFVIDIPPVTWEDCTLRSWLNGTFYQDAFSPEEREAIQTTPVKNEDNPITEVDGGNDTEDKVYLLSLSEAAMTAYGFPVNDGKDSQPRAAEGTPYAVSRSFSGETQMDWWLRSPGYSQKRVATVEASGKIDDDSGRFTDISLGVRPVLRIDLSASGVWESAGTVTAAGPAQPTQEPEKTPSQTAGTTTRPTEEPSEPDWSLPLGPSHGPLIRQTPKPSPTKTPAATKTPEATSAPKVTPVPRKPAPTTKMRPGEKKAISSFQDLKAMEDIPSGSYYLTKDITVPANTQLFWDYPFTGTLDGRGHKIKGYTVNKTFVIGQEVTHDLEAGGGHDLIVEEPYAGIFYAASGATFKNLSLTKVNINVQTEDYAIVGALVSEASNCKFNDVHVSGKISVKSLRENPLRYTGFSVGGITGSGGGTLTNCSNSASISVNCKNSYFSEGASVGGLGGDFSCSKMKKCMNSGNISLSGYSGASDSGVGMRAAGLVADRGAGTITSCTNSGKVALNVYAGRTNYETLVKYTWQEPRPAGEIGCPGGAYAAGIAICADYITSGGNTGKIHMTYKLERTTGIHVGGLLSQIVWKGWKCCNKGTVSFSGRTGGSSLAGETMGSTVGGLFGLYNKTVTECYNKGKVSAQIDNPGLYALGMGGVAGYSNSYYAGVTNCYNTGTVSCKSKGGIVGGVVGGYDGGWIFNKEKLKPRMKYNYNTGKVTGPRKSGVRSLLSGYCGSLLIMQNKHAVFDNYSTGSGELYGLKPSSKYLKPLGKKVSRITKANCPKLSSKYWVYSPKVKRLVLKNNNETKSVKKATGKKKKTSKKK